MIITSATALLLVALGVFSGMLGALVGIGGGIIVVPALVLLFGFDIKLAVAASLVTVVATSTTAGSVYVGKGLANMRLGMSLEVATTLGGLSGGLAAALISPSILSGLFAAMMGVTAALLLRKEKEAKPAAAINDPPVNNEVPSGHEEPGALAGSYFDGERKQVVEYRAVRLWLGGVVSFGAGVVSGLLGVGGGFIKVPAMHLGMRVPIKVAAATSNFMIGVTAISSLFVYLARGYVHPAIAAPVALGTAAGSLYGTRLAKTISAKTLKYLLAAILVVVGVQMLLRAVGVSHGR
jgi:uncharacterized membrane protein YfcA